MHQRQKASQPESTNTTESTGNQTKEAEESTETVTETSESITEASDATEGSETKDSTEARITLVIYFSNTGNTKNIAELVAGELSADIYEIVAATPYTDADLDWNDSSSRS